MSGFSQILVPTDYSEAADAALRVAARLARAFKGRLLVTHTLPLPIYTMTEFPIAPMDGTWIADETAHLRDHVRGVLEAEGEVPSLEVEVVVDVAFLHIVQLAAERQVDLIVMGTHGRTGFKHLLLGSVAEKVVRLAPCPVLTVRSDGATRVGAVVPSAPMPSARVEQLAPGTVGHLMRRPVVTIGSDALLEEARRSMVEHGIRHLPVVERGKLVGMLSAGDLGPHVGQLERTKVNMAMTAEPASVAAAVDADAAARLMLRRRVRALPVVDGEQVVGVISATDILEEYVRAARA